MNYIMCESIRNMMVEVFMWPYTMTVYVLPRMMPSYNFRRPWTFSDVTGSAFREFFFREHLRLSHHVEGFDLVSSLSM